MQLKHESRESAIKDLKGFRSLSNLYEKLHSFLPPLSDYWTTINKNEPLSNKIVITIPKIQGLSLYDYVSKTDLNHDNSATLRDVLKTTTQFISCIQQTRTKRIKLTSLIYDSFFSNKGRAPIRKHKTLQLFNFLKLEENSQFLIVGGDKIINPLFFFANYNNFHEIDEYLKNVKDVTDEEATNLVNKVNTMDMSFKKLQKKYFSQLSKKIGAVKASQFYQLESYLNNVFNLMVQQNIPFVGDMEQKHANMMKKK